MNQLLPGVPPTGKPVRMAVCVVAGFRDGKLSHEHSYWDQASVLVQVGRPRLTGQRHGPGSWPVRAG